MSEDFRLEAINEMLKVDKSECLLMKSFYILKINKENWISRIIIIFISILLAASISFVNTIPVLKETLSVLLDTLLAIFGIVFTGYAFFQALLNGKLIAILIEDIEKEKKDSKGKNTLHKTNWNFIQLMMQFIIAIFITVILRIVLSCMPERFRLFENLIANVVLATVLLSVYFYHITVCMWRMVSFIFNIYQLFNTYSVTKYLSFKENSNNEV